MSGRHGRNNSNAGEGRAGLGNVRVLEPEHPLGEALEVETGARSEQRRKLGDDSVHGARRRLGDSGEGCGVRQGKGWGLL
jgi:hypothetical protein